MKHGMEWPNLRGTLLQQIAANGDSRRFAKERTSPVVLKVLGELEHDGLIELRQETGRDLIYRLCPASHR